MFLAIRADQKDAHQRHRETESQIDQILKQWIQGG